jgi:alkylation response protein AidB-like acyl-CoA dehydrogenase
VTVAPDLQHQVSELVAELLAAHDPKTSDPAEFLGAQYDAGLAWVHFPVGLGGLGGLDAARGLQILVDEPLAAAGAPNPFLRNPIGVGMAAPTVVTHGSAEQKERLLRPLFTGKELWCQLFSEPGAGSDLAALATSAVRDGNGWVLNGQKVWTSVAHLAQWALLVARSDPDAPKHRGLSYFVLDMHAPGVEVRPLIQATGDAEFNEVYLSDVRVADADRLGDVGQGWAVAMTTLMNERVAIGGQPSPRGAGMIGEAMRVWRELGCDDPVLRDELVRHWVAAEALRLTNIRAGQTAARGTPGPQGSIGKIVSAELNQRISAFTVQLMGMAGTLYPGGYVMGRPERLGSRNDQQRMLRSIANSIEGGTTEIMRNILAERVLKLPPEPRTDRDTPWSQLPRS